MAHLTEKQIAKAWANRNQADGYNIGNDILIKGCNIENLKYVVDITAEDITENLFCGEFNADSYYIITNIHYGMWDDVIEVSDIEDIANRYYYD